MPVQQHQNALPGHPGQFPDSGQRELLAAARRAHNAKQRAEKDARRPAATRRQSLRRVKDSREELRRTTRARGASSGTIDSAATSTTTPSGQSFTVANFNRGIIYLRFVLCLALPHCSSPFLAI